MRIKTFSKPAIIKEYFLFEPIKSFPCKYVPVSIGMRYAEGWTLGLFIICKQEAIILPLLWRSDLALCWPVSQDIEYKVNSFLCVSTQKTRRSGRLGQSLVISMKKGNYLWIRILHFTVLKLISDCTPLFICMQKQLWAHIGNKNLNYKWAPPLSIYLSLRLSVISVPHHCQQ